MVPETRKAALEFGETQDASQSSPSVQVCQLLYIRQLENASSKP